MKKFLNLCVAMMIASTLLANIAPSGAEISELYFDSAGNWKLELGFHNYDVLYIDSIQLTSTTDTATVLNYNLMACRNGRFDSIAVITNENLNKPMFIDRNGDYVTTHAYINGIISLGDNYLSYYSTSQISGEFSLAFIYWDNFGVICIDATPSIGFCNDTVGHMANLKGRIYINNNPVGSGTLKWFQHDFGSFYATVDGNGYFSDRVIANHYSCNEVFYQANPPYTYPGAIGNEGYSYNFVAGQTLTHDFYFTYNDIEDPSSEQQEAQVFTFPNPFDEEVFLYIDLPTTDIENYMLAISDLQGKQITEFPIQNKSEKITWRPEGNVPAGVYLYRLIYEGDVIYSGKIIRQ
ncbi:MAG: T9SS type A sorting domain-containing protein [Bacteroidales bacterium]|nr:T9SS type A sorting domain-containing protein [Bacteroidales bacterium]